MSKISLLLQRIMLLLLNKYMINERSRDEFIVSTNGYSTRKYFYHYSLKDINVSSITNTRRRHYFIIYEYCECCRRMHQTDIQYHVTPDVHTSFLPSWEGVGRSHKNMLEYCLKILSSTYCLLSYFDVIQ